jgi:hypothetical protein
MLYHTTFLDSLDATPIGDRCLPPSGRSVSPGRGRARRPSPARRSATFTFARAGFHEVMNLYGVKMAAVFMISTSTIGVRTGFTPRWIAYLGFACALLLLLSGRYIDWIFMVFPLWVLLISIYILIDKLRRPSQTVVASPGQTSS